MLCVWRITHTQWVTGVTAAASNVTLQIGVLSTRPTFLFCCIVKRLSAHVGGEREAQGATWDGHREGLVWVTTEGTFPGKSLCTIHTNSGFY